MRLRQPSLLLTTLLTLPRPRPTSADTGLSNFTTNPLLGLQQLPLPFFSTQLNPYPSTMAPRLAPVVSISHGGGPMPILGDPASAALVKSLKTRVPQILKLGTAEQPRAIVLVTAHWSTSVPTISAAERHELLYDYYGFPEEAYNLRYEAPGSPEVAALVEGALREGGLEGRRDLARGWDHGVFVPMTVIHPTASIPIVQLSVLRSEDPATHFAIGRALSKLRAQNIAIVGSGFASLHNLRAMFSGATKTSEFKKLNERWSKEVSEAVQTQDVEERGRKFEGWRKWEGAYEMHPRGGAEHFLPLVVCAGAGGEGRGEKWRDEYVGLDMWSYYWE